MRTARQPLARRRSAATFLAVVAVVAALLPIDVPAAATAPVTGGRHWIGAWETAAQAPMGPTWQGPNWSQDGFADHSVRHVVRVSVGGPAVRIRVSNVFGQTPLRLTGATVGRAATGAAMLPGTVRRLRFDHSPSTVVPVGRERFSDAVPLPVAPLERLTVTLHFAEPTGPATFHEFATATTYRASGDRLLDESAGAYAQTGLSSYYLSGVDVARRDGPARHSVVLVGDSITDGVGATVDADNRWPDELAERLAADRRSLGVLNAGLSGNRVLTDAPCYGESLTSRFDRDVLGQSGVRTVIVLEGVNDLGAPLWDDPCLGARPVVTADQLIEGFRSLIRAAHRRGVTIVGCTILPFKGGGYYSEEGERTRTAVNRWIRESGEFDAVVDLAGVVADPNDPARMRADYNGGDGIHPNDAGYHAMAGAVDLDAL
jgi:lysophospholipase L1-like esterase